MAKKKFIVKISTIIDGSRVEKTYEQEATKMGAAVSRAIKGFRMDVDVTGKRFKEVLITVNN